MILKFCSLPLSFGFTYPSPTIENESVNTFTLIHSEYRIKLLLRAAFTICGDYKETAI